MPQVVGGSVVEIVLNGVTFSQQTINRFFYQSITFTDPINELIDVFDTVVVSYLTTIMNANAGFTSIVAQTVQGGSQFGSKSVVENGIGGGDMLPTFVALDFTYVRGGALERNGYKRFAGIGEASQAQGVPNSSYVAVINAGITALSQELLTTGDTWEPVIRRTRVNRVPQVPPKYYNVSSVIFSKIGSQNSRKVGHGR